MILLLQRTISISILLVLLSTSTAFSSQTAESVKKKVDNSIVTRQNTQKKQDQWEKEKAGLLITYEQLKEQNVLLKETHKALTKEENAHNTLLENLKSEKNAHEKIQREMLPFLQEVQSSLNALVSNDPPFLSEERKNRLQKLAAIMEDIEISIAEKYRKVMETLFVEAEYGNTIEVTQDKISLSGNEVLADIFRLGRISLFALTLDHKTAGVFNVAENQWTPLAAEYLSPVIAAVEMGSKRRTVEIISLPIGQLAR
ncbi:DUF3450 domain-containing protein [Desulfocicer niacini]